jgi:protein gp37
VTGCPETLAERWRGIPGNPYEQGFALKLWPQRLEQPLKWSRPRMIFVNSMSDLLNAVPAERASKPVAQACRRVVGVLVQ